MRRIFHPVGQGAFFSEHFDEATKPFTIVYDCGSLTLDAISMRTKVNSSFRKGQVIDVLFISHFHADHINGIDFLKNQCKIRNVVIPYLTEEAKILTRIANYASTGSTDSRLIDDPQGFFGGNTRVIQVSEADTEGGIIEDRPNENFPIDDEEDEERSRRAARPSAGPITTIASGTRLTAGAIPFWMFVPYNFRMKERVGIFRTALAGLGIDLDDLQSIETIKSHETEVIAAYTAVNRDLNRNTMFLYSGPNDPKDTTLFSPMLPDHEFFWWFHWHGQIPRGCLYTGDADLREAGLVDYLRISLSGFAPLIGTCIIPHHGAIKNYHADIWRFLTNTRFGVLNYGTTNTYGHPSDAVIADVVTPKRFIIRVTEERKTLAVFK
jgi:hypothetical protein